MFIIPPEILVQIAQTHFLRSKLIANVNQQHCVQDQRDFSRLFLRLIALTARVGREGKINM